MKRDFTIIGALILVMIMASFVVGVKRISVSFESDQLFARPPEWCMGSGPDGCDRSPATSKGEDFSDIGPSVGSWEWQVRESLDPRSGSLIDNDYRNTDVVPPGGNSADDLMQYFLDTQTKAGESYREFTSRVEQERARLAAEEKEKKAQQQKEEEKQKQQKATDDTNPEVVDPKELDGGVWYSQNQVTGEMTEINANQTPDSGEPVFVVKEGEWYYIDDVSGNAIHLTPFSGQSDVFLTGEFEVRDRDGNEYTFAATIENGSIIPLPENRQIITNVDQLGDGNWFTQNQITGEIMYVNPFESPLSGEPLFVQKNGEWYYIDDTTGEPRHLTAFDGTSDVTTYGEYVLSDETGKNHIFPMTADDGVAVFENDTGIAFSDIRDGVITAPVARGDDGSTENVDIYLGGEFAIVQGGDFDALDQKLNRDPGSFSSYNPFRTQFDYEERKVFSGDPRTWPKNLVIKLFPKLEKPMERAETVFDVVKGKWHPPVVIKNLNWRLDNSNQDSNYVANLLAQANNGSTDDNAINEVIDTILNETRMISGYVFLTNESGQRAGILDIEIETCTGISAKTNVFGKFSFPAATGSSFCLRIKPGQVDYKEVVGPFTNQLDSSYSAISSYEWQLADTNCSTDSMCNAYQKVNNLSFDNSFLFEYALKSASPKTTPTPGPTADEVVVAGRVYDATNNVGFANITIDSCLGFTTKTDVNGYYSFVTNFGNQFCVRHSGVIDNDPDYNFVGIIESYEWQRAGIDCRIGGPPCNEFNRSADLPTDNLYDFVYIVQTATPAPTPTATPVPKNTPTPVSTPIPTPPAPKVSAPNGKVVIMGRVSMEKTNVGIKGVNIGGCGYNVTTDANGYFYTFFKPGDLFCVRIVSIGDNSLPNGNWRIYNRLMQLYTAGPPAYYEWQKAARNCSDVKSSCPSNETTFDLPVDNRYDFLYRTK